MMVWTAVTFFEIPLQRKPSRTLVSGACSMCRVVRPHVRP